MTIRESYERQELEFLCDDACSNIGHGKRMREEEPCPYRTAFQRDRDRILHCNAFRRLKHKTQVFLSPFGDHYRTRLTHTLEVSQIARTIARAMRLNEDLTEAIALGHDLGHSPFGHSGEAVLNSVCPHGYRHYEQSLRVVDCLEKDGRGLNLTEEVRNGILCHTNKNSMTREGNVVRVSDRIAYMNHDIEDAIRAGILTSADIPREITDVLGNTKTERISTLVGAVIAHGTAEIGMAQDIQKAHDALHMFMFDHVYHNPRAKSEEVKANRLIEMLYHYFVENADEMPEEYRIIAEKEDVHRAVCDYISGMSDSYAVRIYQDLFVPQEWGLR